MKQLFAPPTVVGKALHFPNNVLSDQAKLSLFLCDNVLSDQAKLLAREDIVGKVKCFHYHDLTFLSSGGSFQKVANHNLLVAHSNIRALCSKELGCCW